MYRVLLFVGQIGLPLTVASAGDDELVDEIEEEDEEEELEDEEEELKLEEEEKESEEEDKLVVEDDRLGYGDRVEELEDGEDVNPVADVNVEDDDARTPTVVEEALGGLYSSFLQLSSPWSL